MMKKRILFLILSVAFAALIFAFSSVPGAVSGKDSSLIAAFVQKVFYPKWDSLDAEAYILQMAGLSGVIRKAAHFAVFLLLAVSLGGFYGTFRLQTGIQFLLTFLTGSAYGVLDEIHQYFVPNRDMAVFDMLVDAVGVLFGCFTVFFFMLLLREHQKKT